MKKKITIGIIIGLILGALQLLIPYTITSTGTFSTQDTRQYVRGFPLQTKFTEISPMPNPPITLATYINIAILIAVGIGLAFLAAPLVVILTKTRRRRLFTSTGVVIGLLLSVIQLYHFSYRIVTFPPIDLTNQIVCTQETVSPDCTRICLEENRKGNYCTVPSSNMSTRGWPFKHDTFTRGWSIYEVGPMLVVNMLIFIIGTPLLLGGIGVMTENTRKNKSTTKASRR